MKLQTMMIIILKVAKVNLNICGELKTKIIYINFVK